MYRICHYWFLKFHILLLKLGVMDAVGRYIMLDLLFTNDAACKFQIGTCFLNSRWYGVTNGTAA